MNGGANVGPCNRKTLVLAKYPEKKSNKDGHVEVTPKRVKTLESPRSGEKKYSLHHTCTQDSDPQKPDFKVKGYYSLETQTSR